MIAMVMCAGIGTRLRPLTYELPKPMVPVANRPVLQYTMENLKKHGITEAVINLSYQPKRIQSYLGDGSSMGMKIHYSVENKPMGTAGGVKKAEKFFIHDPDEDFLVTSGDGLTDINFSSLIHFHRSKKSFGTIAVREVNARFEYGVVLTNPQNRINRFVEKPSWSDIFSNKVNTGIYVFNKKVFGMIPKNTFYDFGHQVWPRLLKNKKPIYGFEFKEFWTDIGNLSEYHSAQHAILNKKVKVHLDAEEIRPKVWVGKSAKIDRSVRIQGPCLIGPNCFIGKNAILKNCTVIGSQSVIGNGVVIQNSILWNRVQVARGVHLNHCTIGTNGTVPENIPFLEGTILNIKQQ